MKWLSRT